MPTLWTRRPRAVCALAYERSVLVRKVPRGSLGADDTFRRRRSPISRHTLRSGSLGRSEQASMASHWSETEPGDPHRVRSNARVVIVDHAPKATPAAIVEVLTSCGVTPRLVPPGSPIDPRARECAIALVRADGPPLPRAAVL